MKFPCLKKTYFKAHRSVETWKCSSFGYTILSIYCFKTILHQEFLSLRSGHFENICSNGSTGRSDFYLRPGINQPVWSYMEQLPVCCPDPRVHSVVGWFSLLPHSPTYYFIYYFNICQIPSGALCHQITGMDYPGISSQITFKGTSGATFLGPRDLSDEKRNPRTRSNYRLYKY